MNSNYKVLIVDDDPAILNVCQVILSKKGFQVRGVNTGGAALQAMAADTYDLLLLDIGLPDIGNQKLYIFWPHFIHFPQRFLAILGFQHHW